MSHSLGMDDSTFHESETSTDSADPWLLFSAYEWRPTENTAHQ